MKGKEAKENAKIRHERSLFTDYQSLSALTDALARSFEDFMKARKLYLSVISGAVKRESLKRKRDCSEPEERRDRSEKTDIVSQGDSTSDVLLNDDQTVSKKVDVDMETAPPEDTNNIDFDDFLSYPDDDPQEEKARDEQLVNEVDQPRYMTTMFEFSGEYSFIAVDFNPLKEKDRIRKLIMKILKVIHERVGFIFL
jgi:hypothetical protein